MEDIQKLIERHQYVGRAGTAFIYAILVSIAVNFFWTPGHIYSSGVTGLAQLVNTLTMRYAPFEVTTGVMLFVLNMPLFVLAWFKIGHRFTIFTFISVTLASIMMHLIQPVTLTHDPLICAIFGGAINGFGTGLSLRYGISTGGLDIIGIVLRKKTGAKMGRINISFNVLIILAAGFVFGWPYALYSAIGLVVNARVMDMVYTRQQLLQVMIVTDRPKSVTDSIQNHIRRGITIVHGAEGAYHHDSKAILFTVISQYEMYELRAAMEESDPHAFVSITESMQIMGHFYEPKL
ncbi:YitT family protein [Paucilactobacillus suebicus]|nr:YitT family protein [Paucilactobacillus suebicus]